MIKLYSYLTSDRVQIAEADNKNSAILTTLELFRGCKDILDFERFCRDILDREALLPTGIGHGIGVPHIKNANVRQPVVGITVLKRAINYNSMDGIPVNIIIMVGMPQGFENEYLQYLSKVSIKLAVEANRNRIIACTSNAELLTVLQAL